MGNVRDFDRAMRILRSKYMQDDETFMENPKNWCLVRCTSFLPTLDENGNYVMTSQMQGTGFTKGRPTLSMTLNHTVHSHIYGNWDNSPYVILMPYEDLVKKNGSPVSLGLIDTVFIPDADKGLILPKSTKIVRPSTDKNAPLFTIDEHGATYKSDHFTEDEIQEILQLLDSQKRTEYNRLMAGDLRENEIKSLLLEDDLVRIGYKTSTNKKEYLSGIMYEDRMVILTHFLRDAVVNLVMEKNNFRYVRDTLDASDYVIKFARDNNIPTQGHVGSVADILEELGNDSIAILDKLESFGSDAKKIYQYLMTAEIDSYLVDVDQVRSFAACLEANSIMNFYEFYESALLSVPYRFSYKSLYEYNPNLSNMFRKFCRNLSYRYAKWVDKLKQNGCYQILQTKLHKKTQYEARLKAQFAQLEKERRQHFFDI